MDSVRQTIRGALLPLLFGASVVGIAIVLMFKPAMSPQPGTQSLSQSQPLLNPMVTSFQTPVPALPKRSVSQ